MRFSEIFIIRSELFEPLVPVDQMRPLPTRAGISSRTTAVASAEVSFELDVASLGPPQLAHSLVKRREARLSLRVVGHSARQPAVSALPAALRACRKRPCRRAATNERDELSLSDGLAILAN
jgi:hypothetical protein